jgi:hypothetical protein
MPRRKKTPEEDAIVHEIEEAMPDGVPVHLVRTVREYALLSNRWSLIANALSNDDPVGDYRPIQMMSYVATQRDRLKDKIDREIDRQREAAEKAAGKGEATFADV